MYCKDCGKRLGPNGRDCDLCTAERSTNLKADENINLDNMQTVYLANPDPEERTSMILEPGSKFFDRYTISERIGSGGMGIVYSAVDQLTDRKVAIKLIKPEVYSKSFSAPELIAEGIAARDIRHDNVVSVYDVGEFEDAPFVVMELLQGQTLRQWHRQQLFNHVIDIPLETIENIMTGIVNGLAQAHRIGIIHRDLKPENIMLVGDPADSSNSVKILDFGLARAAQNRSQNLSSTARGTASYIAPEQLTHSGLETETADIYAVAKIFFELLVGSLPDGHWQAPSTFRTDVSTQLDALIQSGLSVRPSTRPSSVEHFKTLMLAGFKSSAKNANPSSSRIKKFVSNKKANFPKFWRGTSKPPIDTQADAVLEQEVFSDSPNSKQQKNDASNGKFFSLAEIVRHTIRIGFCLLFAGLSGFNDEFRRYVSEGGDLIVIVSQLTISFFALVSIYWPSALRYLAIAFAVSVPIIIFRTPWVNFLAVWIIGAVLAAALWAWDYLAKNKKTKGPSL